MEILFVTAAIAPYHPSSELGDVSRALSKALRGLDHKVTVVSPLYSGTDPASHSLARKLSTVDVTAGGETHKCAIHEGRTTGGVALTFVDAPIFGEAPADEDDATARTAAVVLCKAAAVLAGRMQTTPDVVHVHGYQAALAAPLCREALEDVGTVLSIHGGAPTGELDATEVQSWDLSADLGKQLGAGTLLSAGAEAASRIVVDSHGALDALESATDAPAKAVAIHNAVDASVWNATTDAALEARFDPADTSGKDHCKSALQYALELPLRPETPLLGIVGDDSEETAAQVAEALLRNDVQVAVAITGETPAAPLGDLCAKHDDKLKVIDVTDPDALHQLVGGADLLLLSPKGSQGGTLHLCAQRYGAPPIVQAGTLAAESIVDCDAQLETGNGFVYDTSDGALTSALGRALSAHARTEGYQALRRRIMRIDASWERAARRYEQVYRSTAPTPAA